MTIGIVPVAFLATMAGGRRPRYDDVYLEPDQLDCEIRAAGQTYPLRIDNR
jgi:hypothetical protein